MKLVERTCQTVQEDLAAGTELSDSARRHLSTCAVCRQFKQGMDMLSSMIDTASVEGPQSALKDRVHAAVDKVPRTVLRRPISPTQPAYGLSVLPWKKAAFFTAWFAILGCLAVAIGHMNVLISVRRTVQAPPTIDDVRWKGIMALTVAPPKGNPKAAFTVAEFGDFCCPQCGSMHNQFLDLPKTGPVAFYFVNRPFPKIKDHENATVAAEAGYAAAAQGKFWPMFDSLYNHQSNLDPSHYEAYARAAGLDGTRLRRDVESGKYLAKVDASRQYCDSIGMTMTPSIVIRNNKTGEYRVAMGRTEIEKALSETIAHG